MKLAQGYSHFYARWDDPATGEQFNIEGSTPGGLDFVDDDYYRQEARKKGAGPLERGNYLRSMSPREELSSFLTTRADCLRENGRWVDAYATYQRAVDLAPENQFAAELLRMTATDLQRMHGSQQAAAAYPRQEHRLRTDPRVMIPGMPGMPAAQAVAVRPAPDPGFVRPRLTALPSGPAARPVADFRLGYSPPPVPGMQPSPRARFDAMNRRNSVDPSSVGWSSPRTSGNPHTAAWNAPSMQDYLRETNRRAEALMHFARPGLHRSNHGAIPMAPTPRTPNHGTRP